MSDNKTLRTSHESHQYVIAVMRDGVRKYISRRWSKRLDCTVLLNKAKRFQREEQAMNYAMLFGIDDICQIMPVTIEIRLEAE